MTLAFDGAASEGSTRSITDGSEINLTASTTKASYLDGIDDDLTTHDPNTEAEWITTGTNQESDGGHPVEFPDLPVPVPSAHPNRPNGPGFYPGLSGIWPTIFFGPNDPFKAITSQ